MTDLLNLAGSLGIDIPTQDDTANLFTPLTLAGGEVIPNRFVVHPMEGFDAEADGSPGPLAFRRYARYASGGAGLIWFEACAVVPEGRSNPGQLYIHRNNVENYRNLVAHTRKTAEDFFQSRGKPLCILQITHSGRYSKPEGKPKPIIAHHSPVLDPPLGLPGDYPLVSDEYLDGLQDKFIEAAKLAAAAGFDGVDVKSCHRYLFSELHASFTRENSRYGGSFLNRTRMLREIVTRIKAEIPELIVTTRLNVYDAIVHPYGFGVSASDKDMPDLAEPKQLISMLSNAGVPLLNHSVGNPYFEPHHGRPYDLPVIGASLPASHPLEDTAKYIHITGEIQEAFPDLPVVGGGYSWLRQYIPNVTAALIAQKKTSLIGLGRSSFAYPDSIRDLRDKGKLDPAKVCITCSKCTQIMRDGGKTGCVIRDKEIYLPEYNRRAQKNS